MSIPATPTPIPIDSMPEEFQNYFFGFARQVIAALKQMEIPFVSMSVYDVIIATMIASAIIWGIRLMYGVPGRFGGRNRE